MVLKLSFRGFIFSEDSAAAALKSPEVNVSFAVDFCSE